MKPKWIVSHRVFDSAQAMISLKKAIFYQGGQVLLEDPYVTRDITKIIDRGEWAGAFVYGPFQFYRAVTKHLGGDVALPMDIDKLKYSETVDRMPFGYAFNETKIYTTWGAFTEYSVNYEKTEGRRLKYSTTGFPGWDVGKWSRSTDLDWAIYDVFVRSDSVTKTLPGQVITPCDHEFRALEDVTNVTDDTPIVVCPGKPYPYMEERWVVIDNKVVSRSTYLKRGQLHTHNLDSSPLYTGKNSREVFTEILASHMGDMPYTIDVARNDNCTLLLEVNSLQCAGWYECNVEKIVRAVNKAAFGV